MFTVSIYDLYRANDFSILVRKSRYRIPRKHYLTIFFDNQYLSNAFWFYNLQTTYSKVSNNMLTLKCTSSYQKHFRIALPMHKKLNPTQRESWWRKSVFRKLNSLLILPYTHTYIYTRHRMSFIFILLMKINAFVNVIFAASS